jgi:D-alanine-D-alanine ligase-like ATP-grasp enzyme
MPLQSMMLTMDKWKSMVPIELQRIDQIEQEVIELGFRIGEAMDQSNYHMADIGIDLGMEKSGRLWIFEVNPLPTPMLNKLEICRGDSLTMPLEYARYLLD